MKKLFLFFLLTLAISLSSCVQMNEPKDLPTSYLELNGLKYKDGDTVRCLVGQSFLVKLIENEVASRAVFDFKDVSISTSGYQGLVTYNRSGSFELSATSLSTGKSIKLYVLVGNTEAYTLIINNKPIKNDSAFKATVGSKLTFKVIDSNAKKVQAAFDFGNGQKITNDSVTLAYNAKGTYVLKAVVSSTIIKVNMIISEENASGEAIVLISASISGSNIDATLGLRCSAITGVDLSKTIYVAGEIPGAYWKDYNIGQTVVYINNVAYFKWNISAPAGAYRLCWIQLKAGKTEFHYDNCTWAYMPTSKYWNSEGLFRFTTYVENGVAKIKP